MGEYATEAAYVEAKVAMTYCQGDASDVCDAVAFWKRLKARNLPLYRQDPWVRKTVEVIETLESLGEDFLRDARREITETSRNDDRMMHNEDAHERRHT